MRIGIVSDLHCNAVGLAAAIERMGTVDELWCAGDIVNESRFSNETLELLRAHGARSVLGNHDAMLLSQQGARARSAAHVNPELVDYLAGMPQFVELEVGGRRVVMTHATPFPPHMEYIWPHSPSLPRMAEIEADYLILGHTHQAMAIEVGSVLVINPGSTGQAANRGEGRQLCFAVLDTASGDVQLESFAPPVP